MANVADTYMIYQVLKRLTTPFDETKAFELGLIDKDGKLLKKAKTTDEKKAYTYFDRFIFNLKRLLAKAGIKGKLGSFAVAAALLLKENKEYFKYKDTIESTIISYLKENNLYEDILNESRDIPEFETNDEIFCTIFGVDVYEKDGELKSEFDYAKTL